METKYRTLEAIRGIATNQIPEGVSLEYKASKVIAKNRSDALCKTVTAFANSAGGQFVIGIEAKDGVATGLDGGVPLPSQRDRIHQIVNARTSPPIENFEVFEIVDAGGVYYVIDVPASPNAPHQFDYVYYKRRGPHSEPMEHYEVEDVRNRPKGEVLPLRLELDTRQGILLLLRVRNEHQRESVTNVRFTINANFKTEIPALTKLSTRGLRGLRPSFELFFGLGSANDIFDQIKDPEMTVRVRYEFAERIVSDVFNFFIGDLSGSLVIRSEEEEWIKNLTREVSNLVSEMKRTREAYQPILGMIDGSGLRLSSRTLAAFDRIPKGLNPREYKSAGYQVILDISRADAAKLEQIFWGWTDDAQQAYDELPADLREKIESVFNVSFV